MTVEIECESCETVFGYDESRGPVPDLCDSCREARAFAGIEAPEGGWPRGSDMDRL